MLYILFTVLNMAMSLQMSSVYIPQYESGQDHSCQYLTGTQCPLQQIPFAGQSFLVVISFTHPFRSIPSILLSNNLNDEEQGLNGYQIEAQSITITEFTLNYTGLTNLTQFQFNVQWLAVDDISICIHYVCLSPTPALTTFSFTFNQTYPWYGVPNGATFITGLLKLNYSGSSTYNIIAQIQFINLVDFIISLPQDGTTEYQICLHSIFGPYEFLLSYPQVINFDNPLVSQPQARYYQVALDIIDATLNPSAYVSGFTQYHYVTNDNQRLFIDYNYTGFLTWWGDNYTVLEIGVMRILYNPFYCNISMSSYQLIVNGIQLSYCKCNQGQYFQDYTNLCQICQNSCVECQYSSNNCTQCGINQTLIASTTFPWSCQCKPTYYLISGTECRSCDNSCVNCVTSPITCTSCGQYQTLNIDQCSCDDGYYLVTGTQCEVCDNSCVYCENQSTNCTSCGVYQSWNNYKCSCDEGYYLITGTQCEVCDNSCVNCAASPTTCTSCAQFQTLNNNKCFCKDGYYLFTGGLCEPCDYSCLTCVESADMCTSCDTNSHLNYNSCQCNPRTFRGEEADCLRCDISCTECESLTLCSSCSKGYYLDEVSCSICDINCLTCVNDYQNCKTCKVNANLDENNQCNCNQGYYMDATGNCQECEMSCFNCIGPLNSQCTECSDNKDLINNYCVCPDGQYSDEEENCQECSEECATCYDDSSCLTCKPNLDNYFSEGQCLSCKEQAAMTVDICNYADCTDEVWTKGEQCDDGNDIDRDGCSNCQIDTNYKCINILLQQSFCYTCPLDCVQCVLDQQNQVICNQCQNGYYLQNSQCSLCSNNCVTCSSFNRCLTCLVLGFEPNSIGRCPQCEDKPGYHTIINKCQTQCGDSVLAGNEECDDGNLMNGDGCLLNCTLEYGYVLKDGKPYQIPIPDSTVSYVNSTALTQFTVSTGQSDPNVCQGITLTIEYYNQSAYNHTIVASQDRQTGLISCLVSFNFTQSLNSTQLIRFQIPYLTISSRRLLDYLYREVIITPRNVIVYSEAQVSQAQSVQSTSGTFTLILYLVGPATVVLGGFECFFRILDFQPGSITYTLSIYNIPLIVQLIPQFMLLNQPSDAYYTESPRKFMDLGVDPLFINNAYQSLSIVLVIIGVHTLTRLFYTIIQIISSSEEQNKQIQKKDHKLKLDWIQQFNNQVRIFNQNIISHLIQGLNLAFLDLVLAVVMHLLYFRTNYLRYYPVFISALLTFLSIIMIFLIIMLSINVTNKHSKLLSAKSIETKFGVLYEDINKYSRIALKYSVFNLLRKTFFIINLIVFYNSPLFQTLFSCIISLINIALILYENPFDSHKALISNFVPDFCIFGLMLICSLLALDDQIGQLNQDNRFSIGWVMLGLIAVSILTQLFFVFQVFAQRASGYIKYFFQ